jgi:hypothetical protein
MNEDCTAGVVYDEVALGCPMVIVLATVPKVRGFKPCRGQRSFKGNKIRSTSFGWESKPSATCKTLRHVKDPNGYENI